MNHRSGVTLAATGAALLFAITPPASRAQGEEYFYVNAADLDCLVANSQAYQAQKGEVLIVDLRRCPPEFDRYVYPALPVPPGASSPDRPDRVLPLTRAQLRCLAERKARFTRFQHGNRTVYRIPVNFSCG